MRYFAITVLSLVLSVAVIAQDSCSAFVSDALATLATICEATGRNELCYGNNLVAVTTNSGNALDFSQPGDIVPVQDIASIRTSPFAEPDAWGIALMRIQANIPDTLPGQNVTFLLFGDVNLRNAVTDEPAQSLTASTTGNINIRSGPSTNYGISGSLQGNTELELIGRNAAGDWVFFTTEDSTNGWLFASLLHIEGDVMTLNEVPDDFAGTSQVRPMQAVYFSSGVGASNCNAVPQDGLLIQTPEYEEPIELMVNDVEIRLGSTVYIQAQAGNEMTVYVVEGFASTTANNETVNVPEGAFTRVAIDEDLHATGTPSEAEPYVTEDVNSAPVNTLDEEIEIAEPASEESISEANQSAGIVGTWTGVDTDGSFVTLTITALGGNRYSFDYRDESASACRNDGANEFAGSGVGTLEGNVFTVQPRLQCTGTDIVRNPLLIYTYDPIADTLSETWAGHPGALLSR